MAEPQKTTNEPEELPEEPLTEEETEDLFQTPSAESDSRVLDFRRRTPNVKGTEKPVSRLSREQTWAKGQEQAER